jgi:hypothetical protein
MAYATLTLKHKVTGKRLRRPVGRNNLLFLTGPLGFIPMMLFGRFWQLGVTIALLGLPMLLAAAIDLLISQSDPAVIVQGLLVIASGVLSVVTSFMAIRNVAQWDLRRLFEKGYEVLDFGNATASDVAISTGRATVPVVSA